MLIFLLIKITKPLKVFFNFSFSKFLVNSRFLSVNLPISLFFLNSILLIAACFSPSGVNPLVGAGIDDLILGSLFTFIVFLSSGGIFFFCLSIIFLFFSKLIAWVLSFSVPNSFLLALSSWPKTPDFSLFAKE